MIGELVPNLIESVSRVEWRARGNGTPMSSGSGLTTNPPWRGRPMRWGTYSVSGSTKFASDECRNYFTTAGYEPE